MTAKLGRIPMSLSAVASRTAHAMLQDARSALPDERDARVKQLRADLAWLRARERHAEEALRAEQHRIQRTIVALARWGQDYSNDSPVGADVAHSRAGRGPPMSRGGSGPKRGS